MGGVLPPRVQPRVSCLVSNGRIAALLTHADPQLSGIPPVASAVRSVGDRSGWSGVRRAAALGLRGPGTGRPLGPRDPGLDVQRGAVCAHAPRGATAGRMERAGGSDRAARRRASRRRIDGRFRAGLGHDNRSWRRPINPFQPSDSYSCPDPDSRAAYGGRSQTPARRAQSIF